MRGTIREGSGARTLACGSRLARAVRRELVLVEGLIRGLFVFQWQISSGGVERIDCVSGEIVRVGGGGAEGGVGGGFYVYRPA